MLMRLMGLNVAYMSDGAEKANVAYTADGVNQTIGANTATNSGRQ